MIARAIRYLLLWDWTVRVHSFERVCDDLRAYPVRCGPFPTSDTQRIADELASASIWYFKRVLCYQRSCCLVWLLRDAGFAAHLVIGAQQWPPRTHAWVTVGDTIVGDVPHRVSCYEVLEVL